MTDKSRIDVFISSTSYDLPDHRQAVIEVLNTLQLQPLGMEYWQATGDNPVDLCREHVFDSEIFVGIYGFRYGWQPDGHDGKSITEMEYDWAGDVIRNGKPIPRLCFIMSDKHDIKPAMMEADKQVELNVFKARLKTKHVSFFDSVDDLRAKLIASLVKAKKRYAVESSPKPATTCNVIPAPPPEFAGRVPDLQALTDILNPDTPIAITAVRGIGGIGKTTLVKKFGHQVEGFGLRLWAELGEHFNEELEPQILRRWAKLIGGQSITADAYPSVDNLRTAVIDLIMHHSSCERPTLLIIDDVWANTAKTARRLIKAFETYDTQIIITTRSGEVASQLKAREQRLDYMTTEEGADLLLKHLNKSRDDVDETYYADLQRLSEAVGGHALALDLVARQLRKNDAHNRLTRWIDIYERGLDVGDDFAALKLDAGDEKEDSVAVALRQTLDGLSDDPDQRADYLRKFSLLGVLPTELAFREAYVYALWDKEDIELLDTFISEGLLHHDKEKDHLYAQHRLLRAYARALLNKAGDLENTTTRYREYVKNLAYSVFGERHNKPETWGELDDDLEQIHDLGNTLAAEMTATDDEQAQDDWLNAHATDWLNESDPPSLAHEQDFLRICDRFANAVSWYIFRRYIGAEGRRWLWAGLLSAWILDNDRRQSLFGNQLGLWHNHRGDKQNTLAYYERIVEILHTIGDKRSEGTVLNNIGMVYDAQGKLDQALDYYNLALPMDREVGNRNMEATTLNNIGGVYQAQGKLDQALDYYTQALPIDREVGDRSGEATTLNNIGAVYKAQGDLDQALDYFNQALPIIREVGNRANEAGALNNIGMVYDAQGNLDQALEYYNQALPIQREVGDRSGEATTLNNIGMVYDAQGDLDHALDYFNQALPIRREVGDIYGEAITRGNIALIWWEQGKQQEALAYMQTSRDLYAQMGISTADYDYYLAKWRREG